MSGSNQSVALSDITKKETLNATTVIVIILLFVVVVIMGYNYYVIYNCSSKSSPESFENQYQDSAFNVETSYSNIQTPITSGVIESALRYAEGEVSEELLNYIDVENNQQKVQQIQQNQQNQQNQQIQQQQQKIQQNQQKSDDPEPNIMKIAIYHMPGCSHCNHIMKRNGSEISEFEKLCSAFKDFDVKVYDFELGKDKEASKYQAFPVIKFISINGDIEYRGSRDAESIARAAVQAFYPSSSD